MTPNFGSDYAESVGVISFRDFNNIKVIIPGSSGSIVINDSTLTYKDVSAWAFWEGGYDITGSIAAETYILWGDGSKTTSITGGGGSDMFQVMLPNRWLIRDFANNDVIRLWSWFLTTGDESLSVKLRGYSSAQVRDLISLKQDLLEGVTNLTIKSLAFEQPASLKLNGLFELDEAKLVGGDIDVKLARYPIVGDGTSTLKGTAADDLFEPYGFWGELTLNPGNDTYILRKNGRQFHISPSEASTSGFVANLGSTEVKENSVTIPAFSISDGLGGVDRIERPDKNFNAFFLKSGKNDD